MNQVAEINGSVWSNFTKAAELVNSFVAWTDGANPRVLAALDYLGQGAKNMTGYVAERMPAEALPYVSFGTNFAKSMWQSFLETDIGAFASKFSSKHPAFAAAVAFVATMGASARGRGVCKHALSAGWNILQVGWNAALLVPSMTLNVARIGLFAVNHPVLTSTILAASVGILKNIKINPELLAA